LNQGQARMGSDIVEIGQGTRRTVVDDCYGVFFAEQAFDEMRTDETRAARDQNIAPECH
jgi:hypothetical protein